MPQNDTTPVRVALTTREAADALGVSERTVWAWAHRPEDPLPHFKIQRTLRFPIHELQVWCSRQASQPVRK